MTERQSAWMSKIKNGGLDQYGAGPFEQQQFGTVGIEGVNLFSLAKCYAFQYLHGVPLWPCQLLSAPLVLLVVCY